VSLVSGISDIAAAVLIAAGDRLFLPAEDGVDVELTSTSDATGRRARDGPGLLPESSGMDHARHDVGHRLLFAADDGVDIALWSSDDGTEAGTRRIGSLRQLRDRLSDEPESGQGSLSAQGHPSPDGQGGGGAKVRRSPTTILGDWRDAARRLEHACKADNAAEVERLGVEVASFAGEYRVAFETVRARYADADPRAQERRSVA
jgi:hypothetical protein